MKSALDCIPCLIGQSLNVVRLATPDTKMHEQIVREVLHRTSQLDLAQPPPVVAQWIHRQVRKLTGQHDPYVSAKTASNQLALQLLPAWQQRLRVSENPRLDVLKLSIAANIIDYGIKGDLRAEDIPAALENSFAAPLTGNVEEFFAAVDRAQNILFLADNAGELIFDRLLLELLPREKIAVVVKGGPSINDALLEDAQAAGLIGWIDVINNGTDGAGTWVESCSSQFRRRFEQADLIIAKGQANYESLDGCAKDIWFLFKVKCPVVARHVNQPLGSLVLHRNMPA